jgi:DNA modification methylase
MEKFDQLQVDYVSISSLKEYANNTKVHDRQQVKQIKKSITEFGYINPILVDEKNEIIAGHGRLRAAIEANMEQVPVIRISHLTEAQVKAFRIADNKLTENGKWNFELLQIEFKEIESLAPEIALDTTGFAIEEIDKIFKVNEKEVDVQSNLVPYVNESEIVSEEGDIWLLDNHKIICGNSLDEKTYKALFEDKKAADMIFTDPPFNVSVNGHVCGNGAVKHSEFKYASGEMSPIEFQKFLRTSFDLLKAFSRNGSLAYICMDWRHIKEIVNAADGIFSELKNLCIWNKNNAGMGSFYRSKHELVFVFKNGTKNPHINNINLGKNGRYRTNVWDYAGANAFGKEQKNLQMHPTVKPVELIRDAILDASTRNSIVLDTFLGSGSTLIAAEKSNRICYGIEIEPKYIDTTIRRYEEITGKDAIHMQTGKKYIDLLKIKKEKI